MTNLERPMSKWKRIRYIKKASRLVQPGCLLDFEIPISTPKADPPPAENFEVLLQQHHLVDTHKMLVARNGFGVNPIDVHSGSHCIAG
jgi:hypothetical protein